MEWRTDGNGNRRIGWLLGQNMIELVITIIIIIIINIIITDLLKGTVNC
jgi:hypothetical protein